jgi:hypothetical protein
LALEPQDAPVTGWAGTVERRLPTAFPATRSAPRRERTLPPPTGLFLTRVRTGRGERCLHFPPRRGAIGSRLRVGTIHPCSVPAVCAGPAAAAGLSPRPLLHSARSSTLSSMPPRCGDLRSAGTAACGRRSSAADVAAERAASRSRRVPFCRRGTCSLQSRGRPR